ncbi:MAG TPA: dTDP-glucose 4,6-dehydratase, partial [Rhabdochlamydiaceae bacterium]|nr:dTDP-glucose 4,6-dehydratase [Rhabdochlamydiaceae bacterium]
MKRATKHILVTGGAGFIGSAFIRYLLKHAASCERVVNVDLLTYAGNLNNLASIENDPRYLFIKGDICNADLIEKACRDHGIDTIVHFAAESHVDRSIEDPLNFLNTNVKGTAVLLETVRQYPHIHFHHVSTDEVYGSLNDQGLFCEESPYRPNSPYAASKAASDHFVRSYAQTYQISTTLSHCSNNYGPFQHTEKFIPLMILKCLEKNPLTVYGDGTNIRDWIHVDDHVEAIWSIVERGRKNEIYDIGGECEKRNIDLLYVLIDEFAKLTNQDPLFYHSLITFVPDRPGHDFRYGMDCGKIKKELNWRPRHSFSDGIRRTVKWYLRFYENSMCDPSSTEVDPFSK